MVEFFAEENANNFDYIYHRKKMAQLAWSQTIMPRSTGKEVTLSQTLWSKSQNTEQLVFLY